MTPYYLDSSAWVKRHQRETGSDWMDRLWSMQGSFGCATLRLIEVLCTIARRNAAHYVARGIVDPILEEVRPDFSAFYQIALDQAVLARAELLVASRHLRGADCIHLASAIQLRESLGVPVTLIASDAELHAAASAEGFRMLDPNLDPQIPAS